MTTELSCTVVNHTGSMIRFKPRHFNQLQGGDTIIELPNGQLVVCKYGMNPANPYLGGKELVRWIKSQIGFGQTRPAILVNNHILQWAGAATAAVSAEWSPAVPRERVTAMNEGKVVRTDVQLRERSQSLRDTFVLQRWEDGTYWCDRDGCDEATPRVLRATHINPLKDRDETYGETTEVADFLLLCPTDQVKYQLGLWI